MGTGISLHGIDWDAIHSLNEFERLSLMGLILATMVEETGEHALSDEDKHDVRQLALRLRTLRETGTGQQDVDKALRALVIRFGA